MPQTNFALWDRETLERFAREAADEVHRLRADLRVALGAYRVLVMQVERKTAGGAGA